MICQNPLAPAGDVMFCNPLSIIAKYLKSLGTPYDCKIGSITGKYLLDLFNNKKPLDCQYVFTNNSLSIRSLIPDLLRGKNSPQNSIFSGIDKE